MLTGQAKTDYQREYMRKRRRSNTGLTGSNKDDLSTKLESAGLTIEGNQLSISSKSSPIKQESNTRIPLYNRRMHKQGDVVMLGGQVVTVPELDADGNPLA